MKRAEKASFLIGFGLIILGTCAYDAQAQVGGIPRAMSLTSDERGAIDRQQSEKDKVKAFLKVADLRLNNAMLLTVRGDFQRASNDLSVYSELVSSAREYIQGLPGKEKKRFGLFKMLEQRLLAQIRYLESIERDFPFDQSALATSVLNKAREVRFLTLDKMFEGWMTERQKEKK